MFSKKEVETSLQIRKEIPYNCCLSEKFGWAKDVKIQSVALTCYHTRIPLAQNKNIEGFSTKLHIKKVLKIHSGKDFLNGLNVIEKRFLDRSTVASSSQIWREIKSAQHLTKEGWVGRRGSGGGQRAEEKASRGGKVEPSECPADHW